MTSEDRDLPDPRTPELTPERAAEIRAILLERQVCRAVPSAFAEAIGFEPAAHHRFILEAIEQLLVGDQADVLIVLMPPGSAKSTYATVTTAAWALLRDPRIEILLACNTTELAHRFGRQIRNIVAGATWQRLSGSPVSLADDSSAAGRWGTSAGGGLFAAGVGSTILGRRADLLILDDPVATFEVAANPTQLHKISEWLKSDALSRLKPTAKVILCMQRMAWNDPAGFLQRFYQNTSTRVRVISLPMEADDVNDPLGRAPGEILWPTYFTPRHVEAAKLDSARWQTMFQQKPLLDAGQFFDPAWIDTTLREPAPEQIAYSIAVDLATGEPGGDCTAIVVLGKLRLQGLDHIYVRHITRRRCSVQEAIDEILALRRLYDARELLVDKDSLWMSSRSLIANYLSSIGDYIHPHVLPLGGKDKATRAAPLRALMQAGRVHFHYGAPWLPMLEHELQMFPLAVGNGVDDMVDALALLPRTMHSAVASVNSAAAQEQKLVVDIVGTGETVMLGANFARAYREEQRLQQTINASHRPPGMVTASETDRRPDETDEQFALRKHAEAAQRFNDARGVYTSPSGRVHISVAAFDTVQPRRGSERLG